MRRRELIISLGFAAAVWQWPAFGQSSKRSLIGYFGASGEQTEHLMSHFLNGMHEGHYVEGQNFDFVDRRANDDYAQLPAIAKELVALKADVIVAADPPAALAARSATTSIPIVGAILNDPVRLGLIVSYAHPGGNVTGILSQVDGMSSKQVELVLDLLPSTKTIGLLVNPTNATNESQQKEMVNAAAAKGIKIVVAEVRSTADFEPAFALLVNGGVQAVIGTRDALIINERRQIAKLALASRLPSVFSQPDHTEAGSLVSYGVDPRANQFRAAYFVDKILKGIKPADLPVEFPTKLTMTINMKTAKALGLTIPQTLLAAADEVIE